MLNFLPPLARFGHGIQGPTALLTRVPPVCRPLPACLKNNKLSPKAAMAWLSRGEQQPLLVSCSWSLVSTHKSSITAVRLQQRQDAMLPRQKEPQAQQTCPQHRKNSFIQRGRAESRSRIEGCLVKRHIPSRTTESQLTKRQILLALLRPAPTEPYWGVFT